MSPASALTMGDAGPLSRSLLSHPRAAWCRPALGLSRLHPGSQRVTFTDHIPQRRGGNSRGLSAEAQACGWCLGVCMSHLGPPWDSQQVAQEVKTALIHLFVGATGHPGPASVCQ